MVGSCISVSWREHSGFPGTLSGEKMKDIIVGSIASVASRAADYSRSEIMPTICLRTSPFNHCLFGFVLIVALLTAACDNQNTSLPISPVPGEKITFTGTWSATGTRQTMHLESEHRAEIFRLTGSLMLYGPQRPTRGFKADVIGFSDNQVGMQGRSVWTDNFGDKVFSKLRSDKGGAGTLIKGTFIGGTGRYAKLSGEYTFKWKRLINNENGLVSGRVVDLSGWAKLQSADTLPATTGHQQ